MGFGAVCSCHRPGWPGSVGTETAPSLCARASDEGGRGGH